MPSALVLWALRREDLARTTEAAVYTVRVSIGGLPSNLPLASLTRGRSYYTSGDGQADADTVGGVGDLITALQAALETHPAAPGVTVAMSDVGVLTITSDVAITILWSHASTTLSALPFGWTQVDTGSATTHVAPNQAWGWYAPERPWSDDSRWQQPVVRVAASSLSGLTRVSRFGLPARERTVSLADVEQQRALREYAPSTRPRGTIEDLWLYALSAGREVRLYDDATSRSSSSYMTAVLAPGVADRPYQRDAEYPVHWRLDLELRERT
jgi:hypothetical protein